MLSRPFPLLLALLGLCSWAAFALAAPAPLRLVSDVWPPFTDEDKKPHEALDLVQGALQRAGARSTSTIITFSAALAGLEQGKFDGSAAMWKTPEREAYLLFSK